MDKGTQVEIHVDHVRCSGCGSCVELCPQVFAWDEAGEKAVVRGNWAGGCADLETAVITCPQDCIELTLPVPDADSEAKPGKDGPGG